MKTVSVCVIAYNEEKFLPNLFNDILSQTYPKELMEVVLVDAMSSDRTREIMESFKDANNGFYSVKIVDNPKKTQASGWNKAIVTATGDVIIRIDAHSHIPEAYMAKCMNNIESGEYVTGGPRPCVIENETEWGKLLLETENSLFGSSINKSRRTGEKSYVNTMFHAAYRREVFANVGGFNENLLRTEDNEFHYRVRKAGFKLLFDPEAETYQYARNSLKRMLKQKYGNGYWIGLTLGVSPKCLAIYHFVPFCFVLGIVFTTVLACVGIWQLAMMMWGLYALFAVTNTALSLKNNGFNKFFYIMPFLFLMLHISYGWGTLRGVLNMPFMRKKLKNCDAIDEVRNAVKAGGTYEKV
ncbi:MAG: glycosyltransferase family 2 protein [Clostridia bacterium]|nr:glycosyltransferase family 2 protein [Clostridia bacterium]